jgi:hypothetical protein
MKDSRIGESLWFTWDGDGYRPEKPDSVIYYTEDHVDIQHDLVKKALASSLQRDGIAFSLGQGFNLIDSGTYLTGYAGHLDQENHPTVCDEYGETDTGSFVDSIIPITWVEVDSLD